MAKTLKLKDSVTEREYTLEFNRKSIELMERQGFRINELEGMPMSGIMQLVEGAFRMHHPTVSKEAIEAVYSRLQGKTEFIGALAELYAEPIKALTEDPEESVGNVSWAVEG